MIHASKMKEPEAEDLGSSDNNHPNKTKVYSVQLEKILALISVESKKKDRSNKFRG